VAGVYEVLGRLSLTYGDISDNESFIQHVLKKFPTDSVLWEEFAILEAKKNDYSNAQAAIKNADRYGQVPYDLYSKIMSKQPFTVSLGFQKIDVRPH
jgi:hypothetical protein